MIRLIDISVVSCFFYTASGFVWRRILGHELLMVRDRHRCSMRDQLDSLYMRTPETLPRHQPETSISEIETEPSLIFSCLKSLVCHYNYTKLPVEFWFCRPTIDGSESLLYVMKLKEALESLCIIFGWSLHK